MPAEPADFPHKRRKIKSRASRIARPKDSMPFARRRAARAARQFSGRRGFTGSSGHHAIAPAVLDRSDLAPGFGGHDRPDEAVAACDVVAPMCLRHAEACVLLTAKKGRNAGRGFFKCARPRLGQCDFFKWADEIPTADGGDGDGAGGGVETAWCSAQAVLPEADVGVDDVPSSVFGMEGWRPGQRSALVRLMGGQSTLAVLPTAGGKSLIYQAFAALREGIVVVVTPLVSLIHSQRACLPDCLPSAALFGGQALDEVREVGRSVRNGKVKLLYVAPERLFTKGFENLMEGGPHASAISLVVVDEAHCVSQWGHNFRTAYLRLCGLLTEVEDGVSDKTPLFGSGTPILALTATATVETELDICKRFGIDWDRGVVRYELKRDNLFLTLSSAESALDAKAFELVRRLNTEPFARLLGIVRRDGSDQTVDRDDGGAKEGAGGSDGEKQGSTGARNRKRRRDNQEEKMVAWGSNANLPKRVRAEKSKKRKAEGCIIVYVNKQRDCESVRNFVTSSSLNICGGVQAYHGGMSSADRRRVQTAFERGSIGVLVATVAFGMGVHCDRVCGIVHFDLPASLEAYCQEIGRAGRDGRMGFGHVFFSQFDARRLLSRSHSDGIDLGTVRQVLKNLLESKFEYKKLSYRDENDDDHEGASGSDRDNDDGVGRMDGGEEVESMTYVLSIAEEDLCKNLDVKFETGETILAILEREVAGLQLQRTTHLKMTLKFFSESPQTLLKSSKSKALTRYDKAVLGHLLRHSKQSGGQYKLNLRQAGIMESQIISSLHRLQKGGLLSFDATGSCLQAVLTNPALDDLTTGVRERSEGVFNELKRMEMVRERKARVLVRAFGEADDQPSDGAQNKFLHQALSDYFTNRGCETGSMQGDDGDGFEVYGEYDERRMRELTKAVHFVCEEVGCGSATAKTGRQVARVLHGLDGGMLRAKDWWHCKMWGKFIDIDFETVRETACKIMKERHLKRL